MDSDVEWLYTEFVLFLMNRENVVYIVVVCLKRVFWSNPIV
jgi:hypothetical protein